MPSTRNLTQPTIPKSQLNHAIHKPTSSLNIPPFSSSKSSRWGTKVHLYQPTHRVCLRNPRPYLPLRQTYLAVPVPPSAEAESRPQTKCPTCAFVERHGAGHVGWTAGIAKLWWRIGIWRFGSRVRGMQGMQQRCPRGISQRSAVVVVGVTRNSGLGVRISACHMPLVRMVRDA
jgi:hypothetical protein